MTSAPAGMVFTIDPSGNALPQAFPDYPIGGGESNAELAYPAEWILIVTGVTAGVAPATVAASILSSPVAIPLPFKSKRWTVAYGSLGSAITATAF